jgi:RuvA, C-terminal domain
MTPIFTSFLAGAFIFGGIACLTAPALLISIVSFVFGSVTALVAGFLAITFLLAALLSHSFATGTDAHVIVGGVLALGVIGAAKTWRARTTAPRLTRISPSEFVRQALLSHESLSQSEPLRERMSPTGKPSPMSPKATTAQPRKPAMTPDQKDAVNALRGLGFSAGEASTAVAAASALLDPHTPLATLIKTALQRVAA